MRESLKIFKLKRMLVNFTKMHGLGNDFVVIDLITQSARLRTPHIKRLSDRHLGVGCDQVLFIEPPIEPQADFYYRIFNADGQEIEQCGNGIRCVAKFFYDRGFTNKLTLQANCLSGTSHCVIEEDNRVTVNMGIPQFEPKAIPIETDQPGPIYSLQAKNQTFQASVLSLGNPHAIIQVPTLKSLPIETLGSEISQQAFFPKGANIGFMEILNRTQIHLGVYERGVGQTLACGSNACAAVISGIMQGLLDNHCEVIFQKGVLNIAWEGSNTPIYMTGPTMSTFSGRFRL